MRINLLKRRKEMLRLSNSGLHLSDYVQDLAIKYGVTVRAIYRDHQIRGEWIETLIDVADPLVFFAELMESHRDLKKKAVTEYLKADNSSAAVGALRLIKDLNRDYWELYRHIVLSKNIKILEENR